MIEFEELLIQIRGVHESGINLEEKRLKVMFGQ